jgi:hypothetical protein
LIVAGVMTLFQRRTPASLMGRTDAALNVLIGVPQTAAIAAGAALIAVVDYRVMLAVMAALMASSSLYLATRTIRRPTESVVTARLAQEPGEAAPEASPPPRG